jgi:outer membrane lipoprotein-sorting protein
MIYKAPQTAFQPKQDNRRFCVYYVVFSIVFLVIFAVGCQTAKKPQHSTGFYEAGDQTQQHVKSMSGRSWVSVRSSGRKASFVGVVLYQRDGKGAGYLRIEALDPFGVMHHLILIDGNEGSFSWYDHDQKTLRRAKEKWHGVPLWLLPHLMVGLVPESSLTRLGYDFITQKQGPYVVYQSIRGHLDSMPQATNVGVTYERYEKIQEFSLAKRITLKADKDFSMELEWRSRELNRELSESLFRSPEHTEAFKNETL